MATRKTKGRGAPGKAKSKAHREALSKALKAFHAKKGKGKRKSSVKRKTSAKAPVRRKRTVGKRKVSPFRAAATRDAIKYMRSMERGEKAAAKRNKARRIRIKTEGGGYVTAPG